MVLQYLCTQTTRVCVQIDLCGPDALVPQHGLNGTQVGSALQQAGGKGVAQRVGRNGLLDAGQRNQFLDDVEHRDARHVLPEPGNEHIILKSVADVHRVAFDEPQAQLLDGTLGNGHQPLLRPLSLDTDKALVEIQILHLQYSAKM